MVEDDEEEGKTTMLVEDKNKKSKPELHGMIIIIYINITWKHLHSSQSPRLISKQVSWEGMTWPVYVLFPVFSRH